MQTTMRKTRAWSTSTTMGMRTSRKSTISSIIIKRLKMIMTILIIDRVTFWVNMKKMVMMR